MKDLITYFRKDPKDAISSAFLIIIAFGLPYCLLWVLDIIKG